MELADSKPVKSVRRGLLFGPSDGVRMLVIGKRSQNQRIVQTSSS